MSLENGIVKQYAQVPAKEFGPEAPGAAIRVLLSDEQDNAPIYKMRMIEIQAGGHSPLHRHPYEHENYILEGEGEVEVNGCCHPLTAGTVVLVPPDALHQYRNTGTSLLRFSCSIPVEKYWNTK
jgi:quercetin dioxygenase-like cupin family protein